MIVDITDPVSPKSMRQSSLQSFFGMRPAGPSTDRDSSSSSASQRKRFSAPTKAGASGRKVGKTKHPLDEEFVQDSDPSDSEFGGSDGAVSDVTSDACDVPARKAKAQPAKSQQRSQARAGTTSLILGSGPNLTRPKEPADYVPRFRKERRHKPIPHVPTFDQVERRLQESERKSSTGQWPPISNIEDIFADIVDRMPETLLKPLAETLAGKGRALRVATMCSGTESPLLALNLISRAVEAKWGIRMGIEHVFSCEIEPYKQAYIERNFAPPLLFRDVTELGNPQAHTAYGALVDVPGDVDLLVAGTSCVDYSNLNNSKKGIHDGGESGRTFKGMLKWVERNKPSIVILENVKGAPWDSVVKFFEDIKYDSTCCNRFDTKNFYIPQTRQRGYCFASRNMKADYPHHWHNLVCYMQRPFSSPIESFMLPINDPRVQAARAKMGFEQAGKSRSTIDWSRCQGRHDEARGKFQLGRSRPFTNWAEGGTCLMSHGAWNEFAKPQPERVLDLMDIVVLMDAAADEDSHFKSRVWDLSQNVDRGKVGCRPGVTNCLTPSGMPYLSSRGGPITGLEALSLQGLPINELLLTRESDEQLQNLAGNAMSSTAVGICILAALVLSRPDLEADRNESLASTRHAPSARRSKTTQPLTVTIHGTDTLASHLRNFDLTSTKRIDMPKLLAQAEASCQLCGCEGPEQFKSSILRCTSCAYTVCAECKSRPEHNLLPDSVAMNGLRSSPRDFEEVLKAALPMRLMLHNGTAVTPDRFNEFARQHASFKADGPWAVRILEALRRPEFRFSELKRSRHWLVRYVSSSARLELVLDPMQPRWQMYAEPPKDLGSGDELRQLLEQPIARQLLDPNQSACTLIDSTMPWELNLPVRARRKASVVCHGAQVDSWQASLGLEGKFIGSKRFSEVRIEFPGTEEDEMANAWKALAGNYELLPNCGQANASLHKRQHERGSSSAPLYLFLEAARYGSADADKYVISHQLGMLDFPRERHIASKFDERWRPASALTSQVVKQDVEISREEHAAMLEQDAKKRNLPANASKSEWVYATLCGAWHEVPDFGFKAFESEASIAVCDDRLSLDLSNSSCSQAHAALLCSNPLSDHFEDMVWPCKRDNWYAVDLEHHGTTMFGALTWLLERVPEVTSWLQWMPASLGSHALEDEAQAGAHTCGLCAPRQPSIQWLQKAHSKQPIPIENESEAGPYEQAMKCRPSPFQLHLKLDDNNMTHLRVSVNPATLMHRALSRLPTTQGRNLPQPSWRMTRIDHSLTPFNLPTYSLRSNRHDPEVDDPKMMRIPLRPEQKRSLGWMLRQEAVNVEPFVEEEVSEADLPALDWCIEGMARQERVVRGGVVADAVGYGKTAISLALIAAQWEKEKNGARLPPANPSLIPTQATLIMVPPQLCDQWAKEICKFLGPKVSIYIVYSKKDLNKATIELLQDVDIVIVASSLYKPDSYFESLGSFAAANPIPSNNGGRFFEAAFKKSVASLPARVAELKLNDKGRTLWKSICERRDFDPAHLTTFKAQKRIVGAQYAREKALQDHADSPSAMETVEDAWAELKARPVADVWGLKSGIKKWQDLTCPPLEAFSWRRVIIDEFHYIAAGNGKALASVRSFASNATWILSGTPPTSDFADIRDMASFLNVHLGVEDDSDYANTTTRGRSSRTSTRSAVENFRTFVEVHSPAWHHRRQAVGQAFLDRFVRQNLAEIDDIPFIDVLRPVQMAAAERACYLELQHMIEALELRTARGIFRGTRKSKAVTSENDRDFRLRATLGESESPEEALSRQAAHFVLSSYEKAGNAIEACNIIIRERADQLARCKEEFGQKLATAREQHFLMLLFWRYPSTEALVSFARQTELYKQGDKESQRAVLDLLAQTQCRESDLSRGAGRASYPEDKLREALERQAREIAIETAQSESTSTAKKQRGQGNGDELGLETDAEEQESADEGSDAVMPAKFQKAASQAVKALHDIMNMIKKGKMTDDERAKLSLVHDTRIRKTVEQLRVLRKETEARQRSLRYFENIRNIQLSKGQRPHAKCPGCKMDLSFDTMALSSICGHVACVDCSRREAYQGRCPEAGCYADAKASSVVLASSLGVENKSVSAFGEKMSQLAALLRNRTLIPKDDRIILFVQYEGLLKKTAHALQSYGINFTRVEGSGKKRSSVLDAFQNKTSPRVLLLDVADESAAGSNLTVANHIIFLSSLVSRDQPEYDSTLQQARGRCIRFGQTKEVFIWRFIANLTIDEDIFDRREGCGTLAGALVSRSERQKALGQRLEVEAATEAAAASAKKVEKLQDSAPLLNAPQKRNASHAPAAQAAPARKKAKAEAPKATKAPKGKKSRKQIIEISDDDDDNDDSVGVEYIDVDE